MPVLRALKPEVILISGHGRYKDIENIHVMQGHTSDIATTDLIRAAAICGCQLLVLSTCEGARIPPGLFSAATMLSCRGMSSRSVTRRMFDISRGFGISPALSSPETISPTPSAASVPWTATTNMRSQHRSLPCHRTVFLPPSRGCGDRPARQRPPAAGAPRCPGREEDLLALDKIAHTTKATAVITPAECEAWQLFLHWQALHSRSPFGHAAI